MLHCSVRGSASRKECDAMNLPRQSKPAWAQASIDEVIPVLDLGPYIAGMPGALEELAAELRYACENVGFFYVANHGVPQDKIDRAFAEGARFFDLPVEEKLQLKLDRDNVGYLPYAQSLLKSSSVAENRKPNLNEAFFCKRELPPDHPDILNERRFHGPNYWPESLPSFRDAMLDYQKATEVLGLRLVKLYAVALDLPADYFDEAFTDNQIIHRITHFPSQDVPEEGSFGSAPHTDSGFMTILARDEVPGLAIRRTNGEWFPAPSLPGTLLVNTGDMCTRWSNDRFLSTPHRVLNESGRARYSMPIFFDPNTDYVMECLPTCQGPDNPPKYKPVTYGAYLEWFLKMNYFHQQGGGEPPPKP